MPDLDLSLLGLEPGKIVWGQLGKAWWPGRVAWMKRAPSDVQKSQKPDTILVHYFDGWAEVHDTPSLWAYGWLKPTQIKDFEGSFQKLSKLKTSKMFIEQIGNALALCPDFKPEGWDMSAVMAAAEAAKAAKKPPVKKEKNPEDSEKLGSKKTKEGYVLDPSKPLTERQQLKLLGVKTDGDSTDEDEDVEGSGSEVDGAGGGDGTKEVKPRGNDDNNDWCEICGGEGELVCCDFCECAFHAKCLDVKADDLPDPYKCPKCEGTLKEVKAEYKKREAKKEAKKREKEERAREREKEREKEARKDAKRREKEEKKRAKKEAKQLKKENDRKLAFTMVEADLPSSSDSAASSEDEDDGSAAAMPLSKKELAAKSAREAAAAAAASLDDSDDDVQMLGDRSGKGESGKRKGSADDDKPMDLKKRRLAEWSAKTDESEKSEMKKPDDRKATEGVPTPVPSVIDPERCRLFLGNLPHGTNEERLRRFLTECGLDKAVLRVHHTSGKRFCFVAWKSFEDTVRAKSKLEGTRMEGNKITVEYKGERKRPDDDPRSGDAGGGRGAGGRQNAPPANLEGIRDSLTQQLDVQRQQLLAKQKEAIQQERAEVMGPHGRGPPPMAGAAPFDPRRAAGGMAGGHHPPVPQQQAPQPNNPNELLAALQSVGGGKGGPPPGGSAAMSGPPMGVGGQMSGAQMGGPPMTGGMSAGMRDNDGGSGGGGGGDVGMDLGAVLQLLGDVAAATQQGPPHNMGAPPMARGDDRGPGGWEDRGRDGPPGMGMHGSGGPAQIGFPPGRGPGGFPPMPAGFPQGMPPHMGNGPPREVTLFCPGHLTGSIIGKQGAVIKGLRQEAGEMQCVIDLKQAPRPPEGDGSAKIIISGAHGNDVMAMRNKIADILSEADARDAMRKGPGKGGARF